MKFSIITPTYKRRETLERAIQSLQAQTHKDWEMIIINDSPHDVNYTTFVVNDARIRYYINDINRGVNFSRNKALDLVATDSEWIVFLDDDDYLSPDALQYFVNLVITNPEAKWFMTNRALQNGTPLTKTTQGDGYYSYAYDYLLRKKIQGDATHCINHRLLNNNHISFLTTVKQGEEWFFFYQVGLLSKIVYSDHNSTITEGYDEASGLNFRKRTKEERLTSLLKIFHEATLKKFSKNPFFLIYILLRLLLTLIR